jgi:hypothetical protein
LIRLPIRKGILEKPLRRKLGYLLAAFFNQASHPMKHACLGLRLADCRQRIKLIVKRAVGWDGGYLQSRTALR